MPCWHKIQILSIIYCVICELSDCTGFDNDYYLNIMFNEWNPAGTLFVDSRIPEGIEARHCIIYGHNMQDGSMLGKLYRFSDPEFYKTHQTFHVYTPEHHYIYKAVSAYTASVDGFTYQFDFGSDDEFLQFLSMTKNSGWFANDAELTSDTKIITLSTCFGNNSEDYSNVLIFVRE